MRINWLGVLVSAIVIVLLKYLWFAHFGGADWGHFVQKAIADIQADVKVAGKELVNALVLSVGLAWLVSSMRNNSLGGGLAAGLGAAIAFALTTASDGFIHGAPLNSVLVTGGYLLAAYALGGAIIGASAPRSRSGRSVLALGVDSHAPADDHGHH